MEKRWHRNSGTGCVTASPSGDCDSMSVDGSECRRSDMAANDDDDCLHFLDLDVVVVVVVIKAGGVS